MAVAGGLFGALKRAVSGGSLFMTEYTASGHAGTVAFAAKIPGHILPVTVAAGQEYMLHRHGFLCGTPGAELSIGFQQSLGAGIFGGDGFILQRLSGSCQAWVELGGEVVSYDLAAGETLRVHPGHVGMFETSVQFDITRIQGIRNMLFGGDGIFLAQLTGPGQSLAADTHHEQPGPRDHPLLAGEGRRVNYFGLQRAARTVFSPLLLKSHVPAPQPQRRQHHHGETQCPQAFRACRTSPQTRPIQGRRQGHRPAQDEAGGLGRGSFSHFIPQEPGQKCSGFSFFRVGGKPAGTHTQNEPLRRPSVFEQQDVYFPAAIPSPFAHFSLQHGRGPQPAPKIPMKDFFDNPKYASAEISPDGKHIAFLAPADNRLNVWVCETGAALETAKARYSRKRPRHPRLRLDE